MLLPNPTNEVGGSFILCLQKRLSHAPPKSHQRSWWIVHTLPTKKAVACSSQIPPTKLVDRSYSAYKKGCRMLVPNPTNEVGGSFILCLQKRLSHARPKS